VLALLGASALAYVLAGPRRRLRLEPWAALGAAIPALALLSASWSSVSATTGGRALSFALLFVTAGAVAYGVEGRAERAGQVLLAILAAAVLIALLGLLYLWRDPGAATVPATIGTPVRYNGLGGNPNTMAMLLALAVPLAVWAFFESGRRGKAAAVAAFALLDGSIVASGSRGAILGAFAGTLALGLALGGRRRVALVAAFAVLVLGANAALTRVPQPADRDPILNPEFGAREPIGPDDAQFILPLESEIDFPGLRAEAKPRRLFETSGRLTAWAGALDRVAERPVVGYGFGTEERAFVDRYYAFTAERVENAYLATALQLGAVGSALLLGFLGLTGYRGVRRVRSLDGHARRVAAAALGVFAAGLVLGGTQSFMTSVGSPATAPFWLAAFLLGAATLTTVPGARAPRSS
jgi:O-antigen ligase